MQKILDFARLLFEDDLQCIDSCDVSKISAKKLELSDFARISLPGFVENLNSYKKRIIHRYQKLGKLAISLFVIGLLMILLQNLFFLDDINASLANYRAEMLIAMRDTKAALSPYVSWLIPVGFVAFVTAFFEYILIFLAVCFAYYALVPLVLYSKFKYLYELKSTLLSYVFKEDVKFARQSIIKPLQNTVIAPYVEEKRDHVTHQFLHGKSLIEFDEVDLWSKNQDFFKDGIKKNNEFSGYIVSSLHDVELADESQIYRYFVAIMPNEVSEIAMVKYKAFFLNQDISTTELDSNIIMAHNIPDAFSSEIKNQLFEHMRTMYLEYLFGKQVVPGKNPIDCYALQLEIHPNSFFLFFPQENLDFVKSNLLESKNYNQETLDVYEKYCKMKRFVDFMQQEFFNLSKG